MVARNEVSETVQSGRRDFPVAGWVAPGFDSVREAFVRNFRDRGEQGAACAIFFRGEPVVDLWGGFQSHTANEPWTPATMSVAFSVTKGMAAAAMVVAHSRGLFELDQPVAEYWPEFARHGKQQITVRQLLTHQAGLIAVDPPLRANDLGDHDRLATVLADQRPLWPSGTRHGYHTLTLGWYQNELIRRTDPQRRSIGRYFDEEIARPLGVDFYIGLPTDFPEHRISEIQGYHRLAVLAHLNQLPPAMVLSGAWPKSLVAKSIRSLPINNPAQIGNSEYRHMEIPSANGIGQAIAIARIYDVLVRRGSELGISRASWDELVAPAHVPSGGLRDAILKIDTRYGFGFSRPSRGFSFGSDPTAFGCPGAGGSFGMADPVHELGFAYLTNTLSFRIFDDPRERAVREACYRCVEQQRPAIRAA